MLWSRAHRRRNTQHAQTAAFDGMHLRQFKYNDSGVCLRGHGFAQFECGLALHNSALALDERQFTYVLNGHIQHDFLPILFPLFCLPRARPAPSLYYVQDESCFRGGTGKFGKKHANLLQQEVTLTCPLADCIRETKA
jgi:hypothetical protein